jgi:hypothetical protein
MKPKTDSEQQRDLQAAELSGGPEVSAARPLVDLSDDQRMVLDCLYKAGTGLTARQIEAKLSGSSANVQAALDGLLERDLIAKLNTVIPSFACRYPGIRLYAE